MMKPTAPLPPQQQQDKYEHHMLDMLNEQNSVMSDRQQFITSPNYLHGCKNKTIKEFYDTPVIIHSLSDLSFAQKLKSSKFKTKRRWIMGVLCTLFCLCFCVMVLPLMAGGYYMAKCVLGREEIKQFMKHPLHDRSTPFTLIVNGPGDLILEKAPGPPEIRVEVTMRAGDRREESLSPSHVAKFREYYVNSTRIIELNTDLIESDCLFVRRHIFIPESMTSNMNLRIAKSAWTVDIKFLTLRSIDIKLNSGKIHLKQVNTIKDLDVSMILGTIDMDMVRSGGQVNIYSDSGTVRLGRVSSDVGIDLFSLYSEIEAVDLVTAQLELTNLNGHTKMQGVRAANVNILSRSGDIDLNMKNFEGKFSVMGDKRPPEVHNYSLKKLIYSVNSPNQKSGRIGSDHTNPSYVVSVSAITGKGKLTFT